MNVRNELRRVRGEIRPVIQTGIDIAGELKSRVAECLDRRDRPKIAYICTRGCFDEDEIRECIAGQRMAFRAGMVPACPRIMFPSDRKKPLEMRKMKYRLMDVCDVFLICGDRWTDEMWLEIRHAVMRGMEIRTDHDVERPVIPARRVIFPRRNAIPFLISAEQLAA